MLYNHNSIILGCTCYSVYIVDYIYCGRFMYNLLYVFYEVFVNIDSNIYVGIYYIYEIDKLGYWDIY